MWQIHSSRHSALSIRHQEVVREAEQGPPRKMLRLESEAHPQPLEPNVIIHSVVQYVMPPAATAGVMSEIDKAPPGEAASRSHVVSSSVLATSQLEGRRSMGTLHPSSEEDWQQKLDFTARRRHLLASGLWSDVQFEVGNNGNVIIKAHRQILASGSPVFAAMLYGPWTERDSLVRVPDVSPETFYLMLEYIYTDSVEPVTLEKLPDIDYVSKKYLIPRLMQACTDPFVKALDVENVVEYYVCAVAMDYQPFVEECVKVLSSQTKEVLETEKTVHYDMEALELIFSIEKMSVESELDLLDFVEKYANVNGINIQDIDQRQSIRPLLQKIRFLSLTPKEISKRNQRLKVFLTDSELLSIMINKASEGLENPVGVGMPDGFSTNRNWRCLPVEPVNKKERKRTPAIVDSDVDEDDEWEE